jgi:hypothetical protein
MDTSLWSSRDRSVLGTGATLGVAVVAVAWNRSGRTADVGDQLAWLETGVAGVVATAFSVALWIRSGRRAVCHRRAGLLGALPIDPETSAAPVGDAGAELPLATARGGRYHRASCALVAGRAALPAERAAHDAAGRIPCEVCRP